MINQVYKRLENGTTELVKTVTVEDPNIDQQISDKEAELLSMYQELEALKASQNA